jgi:hypothetical protein
VVPITAAKAQAAPAKGSSGAGLGILIALAGVAAAGGLFYFLQVKPGQTAKTPDSKPNTEQVAAATATETPKAEETAKADPDAEKPKDDAIDISQLGDATASAAPGTAPGGPLPSGALAQNGGPDEAKGAERPVKVNPDGTLDDAMKKAAGTEGDKPEEKPTAAADDVSTPKNIPDRPATGSVTAAIGSVMGGAKACVAGADDVSRATVTFGSSGAVQSVSVSGWAAGKPAASCIQSALKGANVGRFSQPTFTFGVTIRP